MTADSPAMALRSTFQQGAARGFAGSYKLRVGPVSIYAQIEDETLEVGEGPLPDPDLVIEADDPHLPRFGSPRKATKGLQVSAPSRYHASGRLHMTTTSTDRIEKSVVLRAPRSRVWQALTETDQFGEWFGVKLAGTFRPGADITGQVTHEGYEHIPFRFTVERVEPERLFAWRWHVLIDPESALVSQPTTLVTFELQDVAEGTLLTVVESGFDSIPPEHRDAAYRGNEDGWSQQMVSIERYLAQVA